MLKKMLKSRIQAASGSKPADLVIKNARIVNVFSGEIMHGDVAIKDGYFIGIGQYEGHKVVDAENRFLSPAFIDGHLHIESSMVTPDEFAKIQLLHGVTGVVCDPHEIANVAGTKGIQFMLDRAENVPFDFHFMLPSCVPATSFENAGAKLSAADLLPFYEHPLVHGLAEIMNFPGVLHTDEDMIDKLTDAAVRGKKIDGHAAGLSGRALDVYMSAGIRTDHECTTAAEARERVQKGMYVMIREGTVAKELKQVIQAVTEKNARRFLFVTDDRHLDDIVHEGGIDYMVKLAIAEGIDPITAIQMATLNAAECFGFHEHGAVAPGYRANFLLLDDIKNLHIHSVFKDGNCLVKDGKLCNYPAQTKAEIPNHLLYSTHLPALTLDSFRIPIENELANVIEIIPNSLITKHAVEKVITDTNSCFLSTDNDMIKLAVIERHANTGNIGLGIVKGLGLKSGAIATTVAHDSHNLIIAGASDADMLFAAKMIEKMQGGLAVVKNGELLASLPLPIAGLLSTNSYDEVYKQLLILNDALIQLEAGQQFNPFLTLSFLALPVIPDLKLTDKGLFNVLTFEHIPVSAHSEE